VKHISGALLGLSRPSSVKEWRAVGGSNARWMLGSNGGIEMVSYFSSEGDACVLITVLERALGEDMARENVGFGRGIFGWR
jgi:hypothetical protein